MDLQSTSLICYLDYQDYYYTRENIKEIVDEKIKEICIASQSIKLSLNYFEEISVIIEAISKEDVPNEKALIRIEEEKKIELPREFLKKDLLKIYIDVDIPDYSPDEFDKAIKKIDPNYFDSIKIEENNKILINIAFQKAIFDLIIAANLSNLGSLPVVNGLIIQDDESHPTKINDIYTSYLNIAKKYVNKWGYPNIKNLNFIKTWNWIKERKDFLVGFSDSKTGRALGNFSLLLSKDLNNLLFRAVMGLEAMYATGTGNLQDQVRNKSQVILGVQENFKKVYSNMYNFRSRYIHGDLDFPTNYSLDMTEKTVKYNKDIQDATYFAIGLLTASLQELVERNWSGFEFNYEATNLEKLKQH